MRFPRGCMISATPRGEPLLPTPLRHGRDGLRGCIGGFCAHSPRARHPPAIPTGTSHHARLADAVSERAALYLPGRKRRLTARHRRRVVLFNRLPDRPSAAPARPHHRVLPRHSFPAPCSPTSSSSPASAVSLDFCADVVPDAAQVIGFSGGPCSSPGTAQHTGRTASPAGSPRPSHSLFPPTAALRHPRATPRSSAPGPGHPAAQGPRKNDRLT